MVCGKGHSAHVWPIFWGQRTRQPGRKPSFWASLGRKTGNALKPVKRVTTLCFQVKTAGEENNNCAKPAETQNGRNARYYNQCFM